MTTEQPTTGLVEYPFVFCAGRRAFVRLPIDVSASEMARLIAMLRTLVVEVEA